MSYPIVCSVCGKTDTLPFEPEHTAGVMCRECHEIYLEVQREKRTKNPRSKHGTRVSLPITCAACGKREILNYIPKGRKLDELLCSECAQTHFGEHAEWIAEKKRIEREHAVRLRTKKPERQLMKEAEFAQASANPLAGTEEIAPTVRKRRRRVVDLAQGTTDDARRDDS
ncbi:MAG: hypothetical protein AAGI01_16585 [Myxococcota bacterium]